MSLLTFIFRPSDFFVVCDVIFLLKMAKLWLGISSKVWVLLSHLHPKDVISKAYPNCTKAVKAEGLVVAFEGPKPIHREEKVVVVFRHPPKHQQTQEFDCWVLHRFIHVTEEGNESGFFSLTDSTSENNSEEEQGTQQDPNNTAITENSGENQENVPAEIVQLMTSELLLSEVMTPTSSGTSVLTWLTTTINHCLRMFQQKQKPQ